MPTVPPEVVVEILSWLPVVDVLRFKCTCKSWYSIIKDPYFIKLHHHRSIQSSAHHSLISLHQLVSLHYLNYDDKMKKALEIYLPLHKYDLYQIYHDGGLVCLGERDSFRKFIVWNPLIDKGKSFQFDSIQPRSELRFTHRVNIGFGYDEVSDDYKAVRVVDFSSDDETWYSKASASEVTVLSLKNNSCRRVQDWPLDRWRSCDFSVSLFFNGALHYCTSYWWDTALRAGVMQQPLIVVFDLTKEEFIVQKIPPLIFQNKSAAGGYSTGLAVLGGHLSLYVNDWDTHEVWIIKERGKAYDTWTRLYSIGENILVKSFRQCKPFFLSNVDAVDRILLVIEYFDEYVGQSCQLLYWYDFQRKTYEKYELAEKIVPDVDYWFVCLGSLLLSDSGVDLEKLISVDMI